MTVPRGVERGLPDIRANYTFPFSLAVQRDNILVKLCWLSADISLPCAPDKREQVIQPLVMSSSCFLWKGTYTDQ